MLFDTSTVYAINVIPTDSDTQKSSFALKYNTLEYAGIMLIAETVEELISSKA